MSYSEFIQNILDTRGRFACGDEYHERHHIKPKCMGGTNDEKNLIDLFAREHFEAHRLLALENPDNNGLIYAWWMMSHVKDKTQDRYQVTAEEYEESRIKFGKFMNGENNPMYGVHRFGEDNPMYGKRGENNPNYGSHRTEEQKKKMSKSMKGKNAGENNPWYGKHLPEELRHKISEKAKERYKDKRNHPNYGNHKLAGENHPRARKVIRLSDLKIYDYGKLAAEDNGITHGTLCYRCNKHNNFMYYDEWLMEQNNSCLSL